MADFAQPFLSTRSATLFMVADIAVLFFIAKEMFAGNFFLMPLAVLLILAVFFNLSVIAKIRKSENEQEDHSKERRCK